MRSASVRICLPSAAAVVLADAMLPLPTLKYRRCMASLLMVLAASHTKYIPWYEGWTKKWPMPGCHRMRKTTIKSNGEKKRFEPFLWVVLALARTCFPVKV